MENAMSEVLLQILPFLGGLEWVFITSFIVLSYGLELLEGAVKIKFLSKIKKRFKVALLGVLYAPVYYFLAGLIPSDLGLLALSYLVTFGFHKLLVEAVIGQLQQKLPKVAKEKAAETILKQLEGGKNG